MISNHSILYIFERFRIIRVKSLVFYFYKSQVTHNKFLRKTNVGLPVMKIVSKRNFVSESILKSNVSHSDDIVCYVQLI